MSAMPGSNRNSKTEAKDCKNGKERRASVMQEAELFMLSAIFLLNVANIFRVEKLEKRLRHLEKTVNLLVNKELKSA